MGRVRERWIHAHYRRNHALHRRKISCYRRIRARYRKEIACHRRIHSRYQRKIACYRQIHACYRKEIACHRQFHARYRGKIACYRRKIASYRRKIASYRRERVDCGWWPAWHRRNFWNFREFLLFITRSFRDDFRRGAFCHAAPTLVSPPMSL